MILRYYPPFKADDEIVLIDQAVTALKDYVDVLADFPENILIEGWRNLHTEHETQQWPPLRDFRNACIALMPKTHIKNADVIDKEKENTSLKAKCWAFCDAVNSPYTDKELLPYVVGILYGGIKDNINYLENHNVEYVLQTAIASKEATDAVIKSTAKVIDARFMFNHVAAPATYKTKTLNGSGAFNQFMGDL